MQGDRLPTDLHGLTPPPQRQTADARREAERSQGVAEVSEHGGIDQREPIRVTFRRAAANTLRSDSMRTLETIRRLRRTSLRCLCKHRSRSSEHWHRDEGFPRSDHDGDLDVDGADLATWRTAFGFNNFGDTDGDHDSDGADFLNWQRQVSAGTSQSASSVPEPSTAWFAAAAGLLAVRIRWQGTARPRPTPRLRRRLERRLVLNKGYG
jgi:hypothetical protein